MEFRNWLESEMPDAFKLFGRPSHLTNQELVVSGVPHKEVSGKIEMLDLRKNPCFIQLSDGTRLFIPYDALQKRVQGTPERGKNMRVVFQRNPLDKSLESSQIAWATVY